VPFPKNQVARRRGEFPGEAGADWGYGATSRPEADEHYANRGASWRRQDKQEAGLHSSDMRDLVGEPAETRRSPHQEAQTGAAVRGNPPMIHGTSIADSTPERLQRERNGPYDKEVGRNEAASQVRKTWDTRHGV
jgi:hypothetical protein